MSNKYPFNPMRYSENLGVNFQMLNLTDRFVQITVGELVEAVLLVYPTWIGLSGKAERKQVRC